MLVNDDDLTYCSLRLDTESLRTALERIAAIAEPLPRSLVWSAAWEMTREAELRARDFVALVTGGVHAESEVGVAQRLLLQAQTALTSYAEQGWAYEHGWPQFADRLLEFLRSTRDSGVKGPARSLLADTDDSDARRRHVRRVLASGSSFVRRDGGACDQDAAAHVVYCEITEMPAPADGGGR